MSDRHVGVIGLGAMGLGIACTLRQRGYRVRACDARAGVAAAFAVNPIVGAAVFAASKVLGPLWNKVSILRYRITGPIDQPQINEVLRQARSNKKQ